MFMPRRNVPTDTGHLKDQRTTLLDLAKAGILEKYPKLVIIATHLGGGIRHCNNASKADILQAQSVAGDDHLLAGTDFPWTTDRFTRAVLGSLDEPLRRKLACDNARRLFTAPWNT